MAEPTYIFRFIGDSVTNLTNGFVEAASSSLAGAIGVIALAAVTMWIAVYGALVILGRINQPFGDFLHKAAKVAIICAVALNAGNYMSFLVEAAHGLESGLTAAMASSGAPSSSTYESLDNGFGEGLELAKKYFAESSEYNFFTETSKVLGWFIGGVIVSIGLVLFFVVGGVAIIVAKFMLTLVLAVGPIFVLTLLSPATAGFFDRWVSQVVTYVLTVVFVAATLGLGIKIFSNLVLSVTVDGTSEPMFMALQALVVMLVLGFVTMQVNSLASGLAGGAGMAMAGARQLMGATFGAALGGARGAANVVNPVSNRLDPRTGHQTSSSRFEHIAQGRTVMASPYRNAVLDRMREGWGRSNSVKKD